MTERRHAERRGTVALGGFSLLEAIIAIAFTAIILSVFAAMLTSVTFLRRTGNYVQAANFVQEELDALRSLPFSSLANRTNGAFLGLPVARGPWKAKTVAGAPSGAKALAMETAQTASVQETGLAVLPGNYRDDFTFVAKVNALAASPGGWGAGVAFRYRDAENHYRFRFASGGIAFDRVSGGTVTTVWSQSVSHSTGTWYALEVVASGTGFTIKKDGVTLATVTDAAFPAGDLALLTLNGALTYADDVSVTDASGTSSWNFDSIADGVYPSDWQRMSYADLPSGTGMLTIANYLGQTTIKQTTVTVTWSDAGATKTASGTTLIAQ